MLVDLIFDPTGKALRKAFKAGHDAGVQQMAGFAQAAVQSRLEAYGKDSMLLSELRGAVALASSAEVLDGLSQWVEKEVPPLCVPIVDHSLYQRMLETWVLQRAGDEEDANKHTDGAVYDKAHDLLAPSGNLARRDLFIHQTRFELGRLGIDAEPTLALWQTLLDAQPHADPARTLAALGPLRIDTTRIANPDRFIRTIRDTDGSDALTRIPLDLLFDSEEIKGHEKNGLPSRDSQVGSLLHRGIDHSRQLHQTLLTGGVRLTLQLELTEADGAIYVDHYHYALVGLRHEANGKPKHLNDAPIWRTEWTDSPA